MEIILVSNNIIENNLIYNENIPNNVLIDKVKEYSKKVAILDLFLKTKYIFSSNMADSKMFAKELALRLNEKVLVTNEFNECKIGLLKNHNLKDIYFMQSHDFDIKLSNGESLNEAGIRFEKALDEILFKYNDKTVIFSHQRIILAYLLKVCDYEYSYDDDLVLTFGDNIIYASKKEDISLYKLIFKGNKLVSINTLLF